MHYILFPIIYYLLKTVHSHFLDHESLQCDSNSLFLINQKIILYFAVGIKKPKQSELCSDVNSRNSIDAAGFLVSEGGIV